MSKIKKVHKLTAMRSVREIFHGDVKYEETRNLTRTHKQTDKLTMNDIIRANIYDKITFWEIFYYKNHSWKSNF